MDQEFVCVIYLSELAVRLAEVFFGAARPQELTALEALDQLPEETRARSVEAAKVAMDYFQDQLRGTVEQSKAIQ